MTTDSTWRPTSHAYSKCLDKVVLLSIKRVTTGRLYIWQQDLAQAREASLDSQKIPAITSPNSSDFNQLGYYVWSVVDQETNKTLFNTKDALKARIITTFPNLNKETI